MVECEKCPAWGIDPQTNGYTCLTDYCLEDPMRDLNMEMDSYWDEYDLYIRPEIEYWENYRDD